MKLTIEELVELKERTTQARAEAREAEQKLIRECTHPAQFSEPDNYGTRCTLCGYLDYDLGEEG